MSEPLTSIQGDAESLKGRLLEWMDAHEIGIADKAHCKSAMNGLLDAIDTLEYVMSERRSTDTTQLKEIK